MPAHLPACPGAVRWRGRVEEAGRELGAPGAGGAGGEGQGGEHRDEGARVRGHQLPHASQLRVLHQAALGALQAAAGRRVQA